MRKPHLVEDERPPSLRLATIKEACAYAKMGETLLRERITSGAITAYKRGPRRTLVDLDSIDAMNARELKPWKPSRQG